jgi:hypothetical protein
LSRIEADPGTVGSRIEGFQEGARIRILHLALPLILACATPAAGPEQDPGARAGTPLGRSTHLRSGHFTYRLGDMERDGEELRVGIRLSNGTHRDYSNVMLRVVLSGDGGEIRSVRLPVGPILAEQTKPLVARTDDVTFRVRDVTLELIYALP